MKVNRYWKVKKENLKYVPNITEEEINIWSSICSQESDENKNQYIYISILTHTHTHDSLSYLGYMPYSESSVRFYNRMNCKYMGEINIKKDRRKKLIKIFKNENW